MPPFGRYLEAMHEVALADDADNFPLIVNDGHGADPLFHKKTGDVLDRHGGFSGEHCQSHNILGFHVSLLRPLGAETEVSQFPASNAVVLIVPGGRECIDLAQKNIAQSKREAVCDLFRRRLTPAPSASYRPVCSTQSGHQQFSPDMKSPFQGDAMVQAAPPDSVR